MKNKENFMLWVSIIIVCFTLYFLYSTYNLYDLEQRATESYEEMLNDIPDALIYDSGELINNPELTKWDITMDLQQDLLSRILVEKKMNRNMAIVLIFLSIISIKLFLLEKEK
jgi:hypothetical protein